MSSQRQMHPQPSPSAKSPMVAWILFTLVLLAIGGIGYFAFYKTGRESESGKLPDVTGVTSPVPVKVATPTPVPEISPAITP